MKSCTSHWRLTLSRLWSNAKPNMSCCRRYRKLTLSKLLEEATSNKNCCKPLKAHVVQDFLQRRHQCELLQASSARSPCPESVRKHHQHAFYCKLNGKFSLSRLWLKILPNVSCCKPLGRLTLSRLWLSHCQI